MPTLIFLRGLPGSGKSTLSINIRNDYAIKIVNPEQVILQELNKDKYRNVREKVLIYRANLLHTINNLYSGYDVLWEQPWRNLDNLEKTVDLIDHEVKNVSFLIFDIRVSSKELWNRRKSRFISKYKYIKYISKFNFETTKKVPHVICDGNKSPKGIYNSFLSTCKEKDILLTGV